MESDNGFGAGVEDPVDDPFKGTSTDEFNQATDPLAGPGEQAEAAVPLVNREGEVIEPGADAATTVAPSQEPIETDEEAEMRQRAEDELAGEEARGEPAAEEVGTGMAQAEAAQSAAAETAAEVASEVVADPPPADVPASSATQPSPSEDPASPAARAAAAPAASPADAGPTAASATQTVSTDAAQAEDPDVAPIPEEIKNAKGTVTARPYVLLIPEASGKHRELSWHENKSRQRVKKGTAGARKQSVVLARDREEALGFGYEVMGEPEAGVGLRAVPLAYWGEVVHVAPKEEPVKKRLTFRK